MLLANLTEFVVRPLWPWRAASLSLSLLIFSMNRKQLVLLSFLYAEFAGEDLDSGYLLSANISHQLEFMAFSGGSLAEAKVRRSPERRWLPSA
jgi:hypothetical protein